MKLGLIQASSQKEKNKTLEHYLNAEINSNDELTSAFIQTVTFNYPMFKFH